MWGTRSKFLRGATALGTALSVSALAACAAGPSPVGNTQWQVTSIFQDATIPSQLPATQEGRVFVVFGENQLNGASGCFNLFADIDWDEDQQRITVAEISKQQMDTTGGCEPADERNADRMIDVFSQQTLHYSRPDDRSLRIRQVTPEAEEWHAPKSVTMISSTYD